MDIRKKVDEAINEAGIRHFTRRLKKDDELLSFLRTNSSELPFIEQIAELYHNQSSTCVRNKKRKFISIQEGFGYCGKTGKCECAREEISRKVSTSKQAYSKEERNQIQQKREETNLQKYGVKNTGQTKKSKQAHKNFYSDPDKVSKAIEKYSATMLQKHGVSNGFLLPGPIKHRTENNPLKDPEVRRKGIELRQQKAKEGFYISYSYYKIKERIETDFSVTFITPVEDYKGVYDNAYYSFKCLECGHEFETWLNNGHDPICKVCNPTLVSYISKEEKELADWLESLGLDVDRHNKRLINPYEVDIVINSKKIAIEYCGLYWHSEYRGGKDKDYHKRKMQRVLDKGYRLITIFSDEWNLKREITKRVLQHILGVEPKNINARCCSVKVLEKSEEKEFFECYHLQGHTPSSVAYGIFDGEELCGALSFGSDRKFMNRKSQGGVYEIRRMAFKYNVRGGANKILKRFEQDYSPKELWSDVDLRWSLGGIYSVLGMEEHHESGSNYWYVKGYSERFHRFNYTKQRLVKEGFSPSRTEREIMMEQGFDRIWDCGIKRFVKYY